MPLHLMLSILQDRVYICFAKSMGHSKKLNRGKNLILGTFIGYFSVILNIVSGLLLTPVIIKFYGESGHGIYTLSLTLINVFLIDFGLSNAASIFLSKYRAANDEQNIKKTLTIVYKSYLILDCVLAVLFFGLYFLVPYLYQGLSPDEVGTFQNCLIIVSLSSLLSFPCTIFDGVINAYERFAFLKIMNVINRLLFVIFALVSIFAKLNLCFLVLSNCLSGLICHGIRYLYIRFKLGVVADFHIKISRSDIKVFLAFSAWSALIAIAARVPFNFVPNILGFVASSAEASHFGVCSTIEGFSYSLSTVCSSFFLPILADLKAKQEDYHEKFGRIANLLGKIQFFVIGLIVVGFAVVGKDFLVMWMGADNSQSIYYGVLILFGHQLLYAPQIAFEQFSFLSKDGLKKHAIIELVSSVLNIIFGFAFILLFKEIGLAPFVGACVSILLAKIVSWGLKNLYYRKKYRQELPSFFGNVYGKGFFLIFTALLALVGLSRILIFENIFARFLVNGFITVALYIAGVLPLFNKEEKQTILGTIKRRKS